jgi:signal transduction histidine kinase
VRIVQEALTNVRKHARAEHVTVCLEPNRRGLLLTIVDDGVGFRRSRHQHSFGLQTMAERANSAGGTLAVHSEPGVGTTVELWLPFQST